MRVRFAPSPTGYLHVGNLRTALLNYLWARHADGEFMLRIDDTDTARCKPEYEESLRAVLQTLGLQWDMEARQSERLSDYDSAADYLKNTGKLYDCYETAEELELQRKSNLSQGKPPIYDRQALSLSDSEKTELKAQGRKPYWRFHLSDEVIAWRDYGRGEVSFSSGHLSDPVLFRDDGRVLYTLSSVVDDGFYEISHIVRGEDHVVNTAVQIDIFRALNLPVPEFAHVPLLLDSEGRSLSKRLGSLSVADLLQDISGDALLAYLAHLGLSVAAVGGEGLSDLVAGFNMDSYGRASPRFDIDELRGLRLKYFRLLSYRDVADKLPDGAGEDFWNLVRENCDNFGDVEKWAGILLGGDFVGVKSDDEFLTQALEVLPAGDSSGGDFYSGWVDAIKERTNRKGKEIFIPLRLALTGEERGPELKVILNLLGRQEIERRLNI